MDALNFHNVKNIVYAFWNKKQECIYVGRSGLGGSRPANHFIKIWCQKAVRVDIYHAGKQSQIPKLECLAIHKFCPIENNKKISEKEKNSILSYV